MIGPGRAFDKRSILEHTDRATDQCCTINSVSLTLANMAWAERHGLSVFALFIGRQASTAGRQVENPAVAATGWNRPEAAVSQPGRQYKFVL